MAAEHCYQRVLSKIACRLEIVSQFKSCQTKTNVVDYLPPLGDEEDPVPLHRGVRGVGELKVVLTHLI